MLHWKNDSRSIGELKAYEFNPRTISDEQIAKLKESIEASGYNAPIIIDTDNTIIAGHQRWHVLKLLGHDKVDVRVPNRKLTDKEFQRINIQDNVDFGKWDYEILNDVFAKEDLNDWGLDIPDMDFKPEDEQEADDDRLDVKKPIECPECGHEFTP